MSSEQIIENSGRLSPSMVALAQLGNGRTVDARWIIDTIIQQHPNYASGRIKQIANALQLPAGRTHTVEDWFKEARTVLDPEIASELHGRFVILALALCDSPCGRELIRAGAFHALLHDKEVGERILDERGKLCLRSYPRARIGSDSAPLEPIVLAAPGCPGSRGGLSPDGTRAVGYAENGDPPGVALWHVESGHLISRLSTPLGVKMARFTEDGRLLRALLLDGRVIEWTVTDAKKNGFHFLTPPIEDTWSGALSNDATVACVRRHQSIVLIDLRRSGEPTLWETPQTPTRLCVAPDGSSFAVAFGKTGSVQSFEAGVVGVPESFEVDRPINAMECTRDQVVVISAGLAFVFGKSIEALAGTSSAEKVAVTADGDVVACSDAGSVTLVQPRSNVCLGHLAQGDAPVIRATFSLTGNRLITSHSDNSLRVWEIGLQSGSRTPPALFDSDIAEQDVDLLDRDRDVHAFSSLIAAKSVYPPLSIGIFANWGGGKSWFMQRLRRQVAAIAADMRESGRPQSELVFYKKIAQVQFNAWHYSESDIMTSLVDHIFTRLEMGEPVDAHAAALRNAEQVVAEADRAVEAARADLVKARSMLKESEEVRVAQEQEVDRATTQLLDSASRHAISQQAQDILKEVGFDLSLRTATDAIGAIREAKTQLSTSGGILAPLLVGTQDQRKRARARLYATIFAGPVLGLIVSTVLWNVFNEQLVAVTAGLGAALTGTPVAVAIALQRLTGWLGRRREALDTAEQQIENQLSAVKTKLTEAQEREAENRAAVEKSQTALQQQVEALSDKEKALSETRPETALRDLLADRVRTKHYASKLGLIAQVRRDFEDISDYVTTSNSALENSGAYEDDTKLSRIVLYIDDLDRCEPQQVVQVLQAVHLLLAFPLFVVVVGMDPRWVQRALQKHYSGLLVDTKGPEEYLEKIFQIPFWLDTLNAATTKHMLRGLVESKSSPMRRLQPALVHTSELNESTAMPALELHDTVDPIDRPPEASGPSPARRSAHLSPLGLLIESHELKAMQELSGVVGRSPRSVKRFVNTYRLLKARESDPAQFAHSSRPDADFKIVLYLLAEAIGNPDKAPTLFTRIQGLSDDEEVDTVPEGWPRSPAAFRKWLDDVAQFSFFPSTSAGATDNESSADMA